MNNDWNQSKHRGIYITLARWCNQFSFYKKKSLRDYAYNTKGIGGAAKRYLDEYETEHPEIAKKFFDKKYVNP